MRSTAATFGEMRRCETITIEQETTASSDMEYTA